MTKSNQTMEIAELEGKAVVTADGRELGQVDGAVVDIRIWVIVNLFVKLDRGVIDDLGLDRPLIGTRTISISTRVVSEVSDTVVLTRDLNNLQFASGREEYFPADPAEDD